MDGLFINDTRTQDELKLVSFSNYKKTSVCNELSKSIINGKLESASNWVAELICSGHFIEIWEIIISIISRNIHIGNPKLPIYISIRISEFKDIINNGYHNNIIGLRNNNSIRILFSEIITVLCESSKKHTINSEIKIDKSELLLTNIEGKMTAPDFTQSDCFIMGDPKELFIFSNEFAYALKCKNMLLSCYWIEWIIEYSVGVPKIQARSCDYVHKSSQNETIWIVWDILLEQVNLKNDKLSIKIVNALKSIFCLKYSKGVVRKRKYIMYFAVSVITEVYDYNIPIIKNKETIDIVTSKLHIIYRCIKKSENNPQMILNDKDKNLSKSMKRIELINQNDHIL